MSAPPCPPPKSVLGRHRLLSPSASVYISPLCLGGMSFGERWKDLMGECTKETAFAIMDYFYEQGGNFIDTANVYQGEDSEVWIGEWLEKSGHRDEMIVATKYSCGYKVVSEPGRIQSNYGGSGSKSLHVSVEDSLKKLRTNYIDLLFVHFWDMTTPVEELMQSLNALVQARKVLYLGISDAPAWWVVKCNMYARQHGLRAFSVYQGRWSAAQRDAEREIVPMCRDQGMGIATWGSLGGGYFKPRGQRNAGAGEGRTMKVQTGREEMVAQALEPIAERVGAPMTSVALAWVMAKAPHVVPIVGGRKIEHLKQNIEALTLQLSEEDMAVLDAAYEFDAGFPATFIGGGKIPEGPADNVFLQRFGNFDFVAEPKAVPPHRGPLSTHSEAWV